MATPSPGYSITVRVETPSASGATAALAAAVSTAGRPDRARRGGVPRRPPRRRRHLQRLRRGPRRPDHRRARAEVPGVTVRKVSDRTFLLHLGGKIEVTPEVPLKHRDDLSRAYTPGVARVCLAIAENPDDARRLTIKRNTVAVVTDGSAVLGLGNIGPAAALPVMEGKAALFKQFAGVDAWPVVPRHPGHRRDRRDRQAASPRSTAGSTSRTSPRRAASRSSARLRDLLDIPVFHDDQHGTAIVVLAALTNALRVVGKQLEDVRVVVSGVGAAGHAIIPLLHAQGAGRHRRLRPQRRAPPRPAEHLDEFRRWIAENTNRDGQAGHAGRGARRRRRLHRRLRAEPAHRRGHRDDGRRTRSSSRWPTPTPRSTRSRPASTPRSWPPAAPTTRTRSTTCWPSPASSAACSTPAPARSPRRSCSPRPRAIADCVEPDELNASYIVPSVFDPAVAPAVADAVREAATRQGNASPAVVEVDHALADDTVPAYQPHGPMEGVTSAR